MEVYVKIENSEHWQYFVLTFRLGYSDWTERRKEFNCSRRGRTNAGLYFCCWCCLSLCRAARRLPDHHSATLCTGRFRLTRIFYVVTWRPWVFLGKRLRNPRRRESFFSYYGPMSLIFLLAVWAGSMVIGFALVFYALGSPFIDAAQGPGLRSDLYVSGTTIFTLGLGDVTPRSAWARELVILEAGTGLGFLAVVMGYFPVLYSAFSRREVSISLLDARAGSPPTAAELMRRHSYKGGESALALLLLEWERWSAELLESHISYPLLCYFRSQHNNQSWISALTAVLDTSALLIADVQGNEARSLVHI